MGDPENLSVEGLPISAGGSGSGTNTSALRVRQKYILTDKATEADNLEAESTPFVDWMIELHQNPISRKQWDIDFNTACSPFLKEMERQMQTAIS